MNNVYIGTVVDVNDPLKIGRVKISILGKYDELDVSVIPWAFPFNHLNSGFLTIPSLGEFVNCFFENDDEQIPFYISNIIINDNLKEKVSADYPKVWSLVNNDKLGVNTDGQEDNKRVLEIYYTESQGLIIQKNDTIINLRNTDESIYIKNGKTGKVVHLSEEGISLGTEGKSKEMAVLGDTLEKLLNEFITELGKIGSIATPMGPTGTLNTSPQWTLLVNKFKNDWVGFKSKVVTLD